MDDGTQIGLAIVQGWCVWALTAGVKAVLPTGSALEDKIRPWLPEISMMMAVGIVAAWQAIEGGEVLSLESLRLAAAAAGTAVMSHSVMREKLKLVDRRKETTSEG